MEALLEQTSTVNRELVANQAPVGLLVDCQQMTSYETAAREHFVEWNRKQRSRIRRLAVVTDRTMWHLVVAGMALASGQSMKAFADRNSAVAWLAR